MPPCPWSCPPAPNRRRTTGATTRRVRLRERREESMVFMRSRHQQPTKYVLYVINKSDEYKEIVHVVV